MASRFVALGIAAAVASTAGWAQRTPTAAMVTNLEGAVKLTGAKGALPTSIGTELPSESRIEVGGGGRVVVLVFATGEEFTLSGPATAQVKTGGVEGLPVERMVRRPSAVGKVPLKSEGLAQAAVTLREGRPAEPLPLLSLARTVTLEPRPHFRWTAVDGAGPYRFELQDAAGNILYETRSTDTQLRLPETMALVPGKAYSWEISTRLANGMRYSNFGDFTIAPPELVEQAAKRRPQPGAGVSERVSFAAWLSAMELHDEARRLWSALAAERPDDVQLKALANR